MTGASIGEQRAGKAPTDLAAACDAEAACVAFTRCARVLLYCQELQRAGCAENRVPSTWPL